MMSKYTLFQWSNGSRAIKRSDDVWIPFDPANTDYANFRKEILADEAQLQDADGLTLSSAEAQAYVRTLP